MIRVPIEECVGMRNLLQDDLNGGYGSLRLRTRIWARAALG